MTMTLTLPAPSLAVCSMLDTKTVTPPGVALHLGTNLFRGIMRAVEGQMPAQAVFVLASGGTVVRQYMDNTSDLFATVHVFVRGNVNAFEDSEDFARGVLALLHRTIPTGYIDCTASVPEPEYSGTDNTENPYWIIPLTLKRTE